MYVHIYTLSCTQCAVFPLHILNLVCPPLLLSSHIHTCHILVPAISSYSSLILVSHTRHILILTTQGFHLELCTPHPLYTPMSCTPHLVYPTLIHPTLLRGTMSEVLRVAKRERTQDRSRGMALGR